jgi:hypothetical protein
LDRDSSPLFPCFSPRNMGEESKSKKKKEKEREKKGEPTG